MAASGDPGAAISSSFYIECSICCDKISLADDVTNEATLVVLGHTGSPTKCGHCFHKGCIERWKRVSSYFKCPVCKEAQIKIHYVRPDVRQQDADDVPSDSSGEAVEDISQTAADDVITMYKLRKIYRNQTKQLDRYYKQVKIQKTTHEQLLSEMEQLKLDADRNKKVAEDALGSMQESNSVLSAQNRRLVQLSMQHDRLQLDHSAANRRIVKMEAGAKRSSTLLASMRYLTTFSKAEYLEMFKHIYQDAPLPPWVLQMENGVLGQAGGELDGRGPQGLARSSSASSGAGLAHSHGQDVVCRSERMGMDRGDARVAVRALQATAKAVKALDQPAENPVAEGRSGRGGRRTQGRVRPSEVLGAAASAEDSWGGSAITGTAGAGEDVFQSGKEAAAAAVARGRGGLATKAAFLAPRSGTVPPSLPAGEGTASGRSEFRGNTTRRSSTRASSSSSSSSNGGSGGAEADGQPMGSQARRALRQARTALQHMHTCCLMIRSKARLATSWEEAAAKERAGRLAAEREVAAAAKRAAAVVTEKVRPLYAELRKVRQQLHRSEQLVQAYGQCILERGAALPRIGGASGASARGRAQSGSSLEEEDEDDVMEISGGSSGDEGAEARSYRRSGTWRAGEKRGALRARRAGLPPPRLSQRAARAFREGRARQRSTTPDNPIPDDPITARTPDRPVPPTIPATLASRRPRSSQLRAGMERAAALLGAVATPGNKTGTDRGDPERSVGPPRPPVFPGFDLTLADAEDPDILQMSDGDPLASGLAETERVGGAGGINRPPQDGANALPNEGARVMSASSSPTVEDCDSDGSTDAEGEHGDRAGAPTPKRAAVVPAPRSGSPQTGAGQLTGSQFDDLPRWTSGQRRGDQPAGGLGRGEENCEIASISGGGQLLQREQERKEADSDDDNEERREEDEEDMLGLESEQQDEGLLATNRVQEDPPTVSRPLRSSASSSRAAPPQGRDPNGGHEREHGPLATLGATLMPPPQGVRVTGALAALPPTVPHDDVSATAALRMAAAVAARRRGTAGAAGAAGAAEATSDGRSDGAGGDNGTDGEEEDGYESGGAGAGDEVEVEPEGRHPGLQARDLRGESSARAPSRGTEAKSAGNDLESDLVAHLTSILGVGISMEEEGEGGSKEAGADERIAVSPRTGSRRSGGTGGRSDGRIVKPPGSEVGRRHSKPVSRKRKRRSEPAHKGASRVERASSPARAGARGRARGVTFEEDVLEAMERGARDAARAVGGLLPGGEHLLEGGEHEDQGDPPPAASKRRRSEGPTSSSSSYSAESRFSGRRESREGIGGSRAVERGRARALDVSRRGLLRAGLGAGGLGTGKGLGLAGAYAGTSSFGVSINGAAAIGGRYRGMGPGGLSVSQARGAAGVLGGGRIASPLRASVARADRTTAGGPPVKRKRRAAGESSARAGASAGAGGRQSTMTMFVRRK